MKSLTGAIRLSSYPVILYLYNNGKQYNNNNNNNNKWKKERNAYTGKVGLKSGA